MHEVQEEEEVREMDGCKDTKALSRGLQESTSQLEKR